MSEQFSLGTRIKVIEGALDKHVGKKGTVVSTSEAGYMVCLDDGLKIESFHASEIDLFIQPEIKRIDDRRDLNVFKSVYRLRDDWHEPANQGVGAEIRGTHLDNAGFWGDERTAGKPYEEFHIVLTVDDEPAATVNLATLLAWATGLDA